VQYRSGAAQDADSVAQRLVGDCGSLEENDGCSSESLVSLAARRNNARAPGKCSTWNIFAPEVPGPAPSARQIMFHVEHFLESRVGLHRAIPVSWAPDDSAPPPLEPPP
jgi:hypothetical protein